MIRKSKKRHWARFITIIDLLIIFIFIFYLKTFLLNIKVIKDNGLKIKFKYDTLKEDMGYILNLKIMNISTNKKEVIINNQGYAEFFIITNKKIVWQKKKLPDTKISSINKLNINKSKDYVLILNSDEFITYTLIYDSLKYGTLKNKKSILGVTIRFNSKKFTLKIPAYKKKKKGIGSLL